MRIWMICLPLLANACVTANHDAAYEPTEFKLTIGAPFAESRSLQWENRSLVLRKFPASDSNEKSTETLLNPSMEKWIAFWRDMDQQKVWGWVEHYEKQPGEAHQTEAPVWWLLLRRDDRTIQTQGKEIFSDRKELWLSAGYVNFCKSVADLAGSEFCFNYR